MQTFTQKIPCFKLSVFVRDKREPFLLVRNFLNALMNTDKSTVSEKEEKVCKHLAEFDLRSLFFVLNPILNMNFPTPNELELETIKCKLYDIQRKLLKLLCEVLVTEFRVVFIDNFEYADDLSLYLLTFLMEINNIFFVVTTAKQGKVFPRSVERVREVNLDKIEQKYQKHLACQYLDVEALDVEIERVVHKKGDGSPGWITHILRNLVNEGIIVKLLMTSAKARDLGLVFLGESFLDFLSNIPETLDEFEDPEDAESRTIKVALLRDGAQERLENIMKPVDGTMLDFL